MRQLNKSRGGALLTALFIMTLIAIVATAMSTKLQLDIYRARLVLTHDKLYLATQGVTFWVLSELNIKSKHYRTVNKSGMVAQFPEKMTHIYPQVTLNGGLYDLHTRYNLNNLTEKNNIIPFIDLVKQVVPDINTNDANSLSFAIKDWIKPYDLSKGTDTYITYYQAQKPAYYPSHQLMKSGSELRLIKDISASRYLALEPYISALPEITAININTASKEVLASLGNGLNEAQISELIMARGDQGISDLKNINELLKKLDLPIEQITLESQYFLSIAKASSNEFDLTVYTVFKRGKDKQGKMLVSILQQSINSF